MDSRKYLSRIGWAYIAFEAAAMVGILLVSGAAQVMQVLRPDAKLDFNVLTVIGQLAVYALGFPVFYLLMRRIPSWRKKEPQSIKFGTFFVLMIFCFGVTYVADLPRQIIMYGIHLFIEMEEVNPLYEVLGDMKLWMVVVLTVFLAPIMEELMFRKMLVDRLVPFGQKTAVIVSGLSFGLFHGNFHQFLCYGAGNGFCLYLQQYGKNSLQYSASYGHKYYGWSCSAAFNPRNGKRSPLGVSGCDGFGAYDIGKHDCVSDHFLSLSAGFDLVSCMEASTAGVFAHPA